MECESRYSRNFVVGKQISLKRLFLCLRELKYNAHSTTGSNGEGKRGFG